MKVFKNIPMLKENLISPDINNYKVLDIVKYVVAIMVICIHCNQLFPQEFLNFFIKSILCRVAVPFFFITSAYFVRKSFNKDPEYVRGYLKKTVKSYLLWSLIFIPIGVDWIHQNLTISGNLLPFALLYGLIHVGTYYHLWYIPALVFSIFTVDKLRKRTSYKILFILATLLFLFGSIETYYSLVPAGQFKDFFDTIMKIIFTTRSGLFYGLFFVLIGFFICDYQEKLKSIVRYVPALTILSAVLLIIEGVFLYDLPRLDMNFLLMLIPFSFFFFIWMLHFPYMPKSNTKKLRELSKYYYFIHPVCIVIIEQIGVAFGFNFLTSGLFSFLLIVIMTHILSTFIIAIQKSLRYSQMFLSSIFGMGITFILATIFFLNKDANIVIKFEFVPCLWFVSSFCMCYLLSKRQKENLLSQE